MRKDLIIFSDLDGTALGDNHLFSTETKNTVSKLYENGIYFCPITARSPVDILNQGKILKLDQYGGIIAGANGAKIYDFKTKKWIFESYIDRNTIETIFKETFGKIGKIKVHYFADDTVYVYGMGENSKYWSDLMKMDYNIIETVVEITKPITHLTIVLEKDSTDENAEQFFQNYINKLPNVDIKKYTKRVFEVINKGVNKGLAVRKICEYLGFDKKTSKSYAFGDSFNDFEMFEKVNVGVAMENAITQLIELADDRTKNNNENGVSQYIENVILKDCK
ncbi:HAD superfamily hydrolase [Spiroplasma sabaudiense Ar-1343]|uniref:HAD superfamily hydrolase n=1 Tax=Spiroplasma sabaudiense Ar-1343 TaxID=1276257 RepID=W6A9N6_9MOLU|nr:Cof-type HAD-IIB family hydrolase [Spiroplasma sabaudiense]AHI53600.1 HAD superfamily hydrolase [Spiroplasma sabaudiense Ar-1343]